MEGASHLVAEPSVLAKEGRTLKGKRWRRGKAEKIAEETGCQGREDCSFGAEGE